MMKTGIWDEHLSLALKKFTQMIKQGMRHQSYRNLKKVVRGLRRRRNWLMKQGQWPVKNIQVRDFSYSVGPVRMVGKSFVPKVDYPEPMLLRIKP